MEPVVIIKSIGTYIVIFRYVHYVHYAYNDKKRIF